jgi:hypothetical protein
VPSMSYKRSTLFSERYKACGHNVVKLTDDRFVRLVDC